MIEIMKATATVCIGTTIVIVTAPLWLPIALAAYFSTVLDEKKRVAELRKRYPNYQPIC